MAITTAKTIISPVAADNTRTLSPSLNSLRLSSLPIHKKNTLKSVAISTCRKRNLGAMSSVQAPEQEAGVLHFVKYHGLGNDFILVDNRDSMEPKVTTEQAVKLCDTNFGIGADGVIFAMPGTNGTDYTLRIFNSDGSEPEMCGNGVRCFARFIAELENLKEQSFTVHTGTGLIVPEIQEDGKSKNNSLLTSLLKEHYLRLAIQDLISFSEIGPKFEHHAMFPARINTEFVQDFSPSHLKMRVWERGAGATLACGTGACAVVVAAVLEGRSRRSIYLEEDHWTLSGEKMTIMST